jgi:hypothetical protein
MSRSSEAKYRHKGDHVSRPVFAVVEIGGVPMLLLIAGVFIVTFVGVCAAAYLLLVKRRTDGTATTWKVQLQSGLPVSKRTFEWISRGTAAAMARPQISAATRAQLEQLGQVRAVFVPIYRVLMIVVGLAGLTAGILLLRSHTPANMLGLPAAIVLLLSLGALLKGLVPGPSIVPMDPLDPALLDQFKEKINVQVITSPPLTVRLSTSDIRQAADMLRRGVPIADAARAVHPGYADLSEMDKRSVEVAIAQATGRQ